MSYEHADMASATLSLFSVRLSVLAAVGNMSGTFSFLIRMSPETQEFASVELNSWHTSYMSISVSCLLLQTFSL